MDEYKHEDLTELIIHCFYKVYRTLGYGFLEKVYENALVIELKNQGLNALKQHPIEVNYGDEVVGSYFADIVVEGLVILELKAAETMAKEFEYQLLNYLRATKIEIGLVLNFGKEPQIRRKIYSNPREA